MKYPLRWLILLFALALLLQSCGGTDTGNPVTGSNASDQGQNLTPCADDELVCSDGSRVKRNPADNCNFYPCP